MMANLIASLDAALAIAGEDIILADGPASRRISAMSR
jgi:hypothetical protein